MNLKFQVRFQVFKFSGPLLDTLALVSSLKQHLLTHIHMAAFICLLAVFFYHEAFWNATAYFFFIVHLKVTLKTWSYYLTHWFGLSSLLLVLDNVKSTKVSKPGVVILSSSKGRFFSERMMYFSHCPKNVPKTILKKRFWNCVLFRVSWL